MYYAKAIPLSSLVFVAEPIWKQNMQIYDYFIIHLFITVTYDVYLQLSGTHNVCFKENVGKFDYMHSLNRNMLM